jgi:predicted HicB family RNase H-like nuclease
MESGLNKCYQQSNPLSEKQYSGRFMVRVPSLVHRALATEAAEQGVSINRLVSAKLAA